MRTFIVFMSMLVAFAFNAKADESFEIVNSNDVETVNAVFAGIEKTVANLADQLKVPAEKLWTILVRQQTIKSISSIALFATILFVCFSALFWAYKRADKYKYGVYDDTETAVPAIFSLTVLFSMAIILIKKFNEVLTGLINPEYGALKEILGAI